LMEAVYGPVEGKLFSSKNFRMGSKTA